jgi:ankyrin repeat protein
MQLLERYPREIDVNCHHRTGQTPLTRACKKRYWSTVLELIRSNRGVDVNVNARDGIAALHYAARDDNVEVLKELIRAGARVDEPKSDGCRSLHIAATYGWVNIVKALLDAHADVNAASKAGSTALHYASLYGQPDALRVLLAAKPAVDALYTGGWTALHLAVRRNYLDMAKDLLDASADPDVAETHGWTPLHSAVYKGYTMMVDLLIKYSPNLEATDKKHGRTPLHFAAMSNVGPMPVGSQPSNAPNTVVGPAEARSIVKMLLDAKANINATQSKNRTALHLAAGNGFEKGVDLLLERGADMWLRDRWYSTPLHYAVDSGSEATVAQLLSHELKFPQPKSGEDEVEKRPAGCDLRSPLFIAAQKGLPEIVRMLLGHTGHRHEATALSYGLSPLDAALLMQHKEISEMIAQVTGIPLPDMNMYSPGQKIREDLIRRVLDRERYMHAESPSACDGRKRAQNFWRCITCGGDGDQPFCSICAVKCHTGHTMDWRGVGVSFCGCPCAADAEIRTRKEGKNKRKGGEGPAFAPHMPQYRSVQSAPDLLGQPLKN